jgi:ubiquinone/menaquinone biosynthesis C-methylase UbiE
MKKADYSRISSSYDRGRSLAAEIIDQWLERIQKHSGISTSSSLLDLGCGTGRFSLPIAERFRCRVTGADQSPDMLDKAREKDVNHLVTWDLQDAGSLTYPDETFDIVFLSHVLHHTDSPGNVLNECRRVLAIGGVVLIRYGAIDQIRNDVEHTFFPETLPIDEKRTPSVSLVERWLTEAGFQDLISREVVQKTYSSGSARLEAVKLKGTSVLTMILPEAFMSGVRRLANYVDGKPDDPWLLTDRLTLTVGHKKSR